MKKIILLILLIVGCGGGKSPTLDANPSSPPPVQVQCRWKSGPDILGKNSKNWNCPAMLDALREIPCQVVLGYFDDPTFGPEQSNCIQEAIDTGKVWAIRPHLAWTDHKPISIEILKARAQRANEFCIKNKDKIECYISPVCEHGLTQQQSMAQNDALLPIFTAPNFKGLVDSGMKARDPRAIPEVHSNEAKAAIVSQDGGTNGDGNGCFDVDVEKSKSNSTLFTETWWAGANCKFSSQKDSKTGKPKDGRAPQQRTDCPTPDQFKHWLWLSAPLPAFPPGKRAGNGQIYKPSSDNHGGCKDKDCKALWITNPFPGRQPDKISYETITGQKIGEFSCYRCSDKKEWYQGKRPRYYSSETAYSIFNKAKKLSGKEFVVINEGRARIIIHPLRRDGLLR